VKQTPISADSATGWKGQTNYPEPFASQVQGRTKKPLGHLFGLTNFGVNLTELEPGAISALLHSHSAQDEFIFVLEGNPTLIVGGKEFQLAPEDCMGFKAGSGIAHQLINRSAHSISYLEVGDRSKNDRAEFPNDDINAELSKDGSWSFSHKDGTPY
jgi:uncharacterized cupin superfamily protein